MYLRRKIDEYLLEWKKMKKGLYKTILSDGYAVEDIHISVHFY